MFEIFEKYLKVLLRNIELPEGEEEKLKNELVGVWVNNVGKRLALTASDEEKEVLDEIIKLSKKENLEEEGIKMVFEKYRKVAKNDSEEVALVYREEAIKVIEKILDIYVQQASSEKLNKLRDELQLIN